MKNKMLAEHIRRAVALVEVARDRAADANEGVKKAGYKDGEDFWSVVVEDLNEQIRGLNRQLLAASESIRVTKFVRTDEDWHPSMAPLQKPANPNHHNPLDHNAVRVSLVLLTDGNWRVCVWGNDDFGLECDQPSEAAANQLYNGIRDFTTQAELRKRGFINA